MTVQVCIIESEAGWGIRIDEVKEFLTREEAIQYAKDYNTEHNPSGETPSWYMYAYVEGQGFGMLRHE